MTATLARGLERRGARARLALAAARTSLASADLDGADRALTAARELAAALDPALDAWLALLDSELAFARGDLARAASASCAAEASARSAGDIPSFLAIWWIRAVRALRRGDAGRGELVARWMESWLARVSPRAHTRLHCFAAAFALDDDRPGDAIDLGAGVVGAVPGTAEAALCGSIVTNAFLALDRPVDAARVATSSIERCRDLPPAIAARLYLDAATALDAAGATEHATRCTELAHRYDPRISDAPTPAELARPGLELRLL